MKFKHQIGFLIFLLGISFVVSFANASSDITEVNLCAEQSVLDAFKIVGYCVLILKIVVPIILIVSGTIDLAKAMISNEAKAINNAVILLVKRSIAGVVVFFIPTIVTFVFNLVMKSNPKVFDQFNCITECINHPSDVSCEAVGSVVEERN